MPTLPVPHRDEPVANYDDRRKGWFVGDNWHRFFDQLGGVLSTAFGTSDPSGAIGTAAYLNISATQPVCASFTFKAPEDETVPLVINSPFAWNIDSVTTRTEAGTSTATVKIGTTALGGTANSASTTEQEQEHSSANAVAVGDDLQVTFASTSSDCENLCLTIAGTRTLS